MSKININGINIRVLAAEGFNTSEVANTNQVWSAAGSYLTNKDSVRNSYSFTCGPYTEEEAKFVEQLVNGNHDFFPMRDGLESTTGLQPLSHYGTRITADGSEIASTLRYDLQLARDNMVYVSVLHGTHIYDFNTDSLLDTTPTVLDIYTLNGIFTIRNSAGFHDPIYSIIRTNCKVPSFANIDFDSWGDSPYVNVSGPLVDNRTIKCLGRAGVVTPLNSDLRTINIELFEVDDKYIRSR